MQKEQIKYLVQESRQLLHHLKVKVIKTTTTKPGEPSKPPAIDYSKFRMKKVKTNLGALQDPKKQTTVKK